MELGTADEKTKELKTKQQEIYKLKEKKGTKTKKSLRHMGQYQKRFQDGGVVGGPELASFFEYNQIKLQLY